MNQMGEAVVYQLDKALDMGEGSQASFMMGILVGLGMAVMLFSTISLQDHQTNPYTEVIDI